MTRATGARLAGFITHCDVLSNTSISHPESYSKIVADLEWKLRQLTWQCFVEKNGIVLNSSIKGVLMCLRHNLECAMFYANYSGFTFDRCNWKLLDYGGFGWVHT